MDEIKGTNNLNLVWRKCEVLFFLYGLIWKMITPTLLLCVDWALVWGPKSFTVDVKLEVSKLCTFNFSEQKFHLLHSKTQQCLHLMFSTALVLVVQKPLLALWLCREYIVSESPCRASLPSCHTHPVPGLWLYWFAGHCCCRCLGVNENVFVGICPHFGHWPVTFSPKILPSMWILGTPSLSPAPGKEPCTCKGFRKRL